MSHFKIFIRSLGILVSLIISYAIECKGQVVVFKTSKSNINESEIRSELKKYPEKILKEYLDTIFVINDERFCGRASMFKHFEICGNCDKEFLKEIIHHEFSSVLLLRYDSYIKEIYNDLGRKFTEWNGKAYPYNTAVAAKSIEPDSELVNYYYGSAYARTGFENDFNTIAQYLFTDGGTVIKTVSDKPGTAIQQKVQAVISFYNQLDSKFDKKFFESL